MTTTDDGLDKSASSTVYLEQRGTTLHVTLAGDIDVHTSQRLNARVLEPYTAQSAEIDLTEVSFIDSIGMAMLLTLRNEIGPTTLIRPIERVHKLLDLCGVLEVFTVID